MPAPECSTICDDDRQYVGLDGQQRTTLPTASSNASDEMDLWLSGGKGWVIYQTNEIRKVLRFLFYLHTYSLSAGPLYWRVRLRVSLWRRMLLFFPAA